MSIAVILRELEQGRNISGAEVTNGANPNPCSVFGQGDGVGQSKQLTQKEDSVDSNIQISVEKPASKVNTEKEEVDLNSPKPVVAVSVAKGLSAIVDALKEDAALKKDIDLPGCSADAATEHDPKTKIPKGDATLGKDVSSPVCSANVAEEQDTMADTSKEDATHGKEVSSPGCSANAAKEQDTMADTSKEDATYGKEVSSPGCSANVAKEGDTMTDISKEDATHENDVSVQGCSANASKEHDTVADKPKEDAILQPKEKKKPSKTK